MSSDDNVKSAVRITLQLFAEVKEQLRGSGSYTTEMDRLWFAVMTTGLTAAAAAVYAGERGEEE